MRYFMDGERRWAYSLLDEGTLDTVVKVQLDSTGNEQDDVVGAGVEHTCRFSPESVERDANGNMNEWELLRLAKETLEDCSTSGSMTSGQGCGKQ